MLICFLKPFFHRPGFIFKFLVNFITFSSISFSNNLLYYFIHFELFLNRKYSWVLLKKLSNFETLLTNKLKRKRCKEKQGYQKTKTTPPFKPRWKLISKNQTVHLLWTVQPAEGSGDQVSFKRQDEELRVEPLLPHVERSQLLRFSVWSRREETRSTLEDYEHETPQGELEDVAVGGDGLGRAREHSAGLSQRPNFHWQHWTGRCIVVWQMPVISKRCHVSYGIFISSWTNNIHSETGEFSSCINTFE